MTTRKLTDSQIAIRIVPTHLRWPKSDTSAVWTKAHNCVDALQDLIRSVDVACIEAQQGHEGGITRRSEIRDQALRKLVNFRAFEIAEKALIENIDTLERLSYRDPQQVLMHKNFTQALHDLREGIAATRRMVLDRCKMSDRPLVSPHW